MTKKYKIDQYFDDLEEDNSIGITLTEEEFNKYCEITKHEDYWDFRLCIEDLDGETMIFGNLIKKPNLYRYVLIRQLSKDINIRLWFMTDEEKEEYDLGDIDSVFAFEAFV